MSESLPFAVSPADAAVLDTLRTLLPAIAEGAAGYDERAEIPLPSLHALRDAGIDRAVLPAALGGGGLGYQAFGEIVRLLSAADPATATVWVMHVGAGVGLAQLTSGTLGSYYADAFLAGDRFANALSEPTSGNRFLNPQQEAIPAEGGYVLSGAKRFVSGSEIAQHLLVNVAIGGVPTFFGLEPDESVSVIPIWDTLGLRGTRSQLLHFSDTLLRADRKGVFSPDQFNVVGSGLPAISLGIAQSALDAIIAQSNGRQIAGAPLSHQQWVQYDVADVAVKLEAATALYRDALRQADAGQPSSYSAFNKAKYLANKVAVEVAQLGVRVGGASGFLRTSPIQRHLRDAQAGQLMAYSTEVLAGVIGAEVLGVTESDTTPTEDNR